jgi:hypothetical protein
MGEMPMKTLPFLLILTPAAAFAASPFDGNWTTRPGSFQSSDKPYVFSVDQVEYRCASCVPPVSVKPDGQFHKVSGHGFDNVAVKILDSSTIELTERTGEKVIQKETYTASPDGSRLTAQMIDESGAKAVSMQATARRSAGTAPEKDKHPVSGTWVLVSGEPPNIPVTLRMTDDSFSWSSNGQHYDAKFDGKPVRLEGEPTHLLVRVRRIGPNEVEEADTRDGKPVYKIMYSAAPDGKSLKVTETDPRSGRTFRYIKDKQP